ncbi:MAG TPA: outer membrane beta-barrel protein, partial [Polyangiaceae bacterium]|nr:outer membrane beta-barrel protein [Polyangiaceae bacterium]
MSATRILSLALSLGLLSVDAAADSTTPKVLPMGYVEAYYAYNFARPSNGITNYRGYDNRSNTFSITNAAIGAGWDAGDVTGRVVLQVGSAASTEYLGEPALAGTSSVNATGPDLWRFIQEAYVGSKVPHVRDFVLQAGVFLAPVGCESFAVKDNWNWSRSNL